MKKYALPALFSMLMISLLSGLLVNFPIDTSPDTEAKKTENNGAWLAQRFEMRKNAAGIVPMGLDLQWFAHDQMRSSARAGGLGNITELGPFDIGGRTRALLIDHSNVNRYFAGGASGGMWISNDRGTSWNQVNDAAVNLDVTCIVQHPTLPNVLYYGTGENFGSVVNKPGAGVFKSTNGGGSFTRLSATNTADFVYVSSIAHSKIDPNTLYVGTYDKGLWLSTNGGSTFTQMHATTSTIEDIETMPNGDIVIAVNGEGVLWSSNNGNTPFNPAIGLPGNGFERLQIAYCHSQPNVMYAIVAENDNLLKGAYKSINGGKNWTSKTTPSNTSLAQLYYNLTIYVHPNDPDRVVWGGKNGAYSTNGASTWNFFYGGHNDNHAFVFHPSLPDEFLIGNDGGVYRKNWAVIGDTFNVEDLNNGYNVTQYYAGNYFPNGSNILVGAQDNGTRRLLNGVSTKMFFGDGGYTAVSQQNPNLGYFEWQGGKVYKSNFIQEPNPVTFPQGSNNIPIHSGISGPKHFISPFEINYMDGQQLYFATEERIYRTPDAGDHWAPISNIHGTIYALSVSKEQNPRVFFGGTDAQIYRVNNALSASAGDEVDLSASVPLNVTNDVISCITQHPNDHTVIYVAFSTISLSSRIYRVTNAHTANPTWTAIGGTLPPELPVSWLEVKPNQFEELYAGTDFGLYVTEDGGATWQKEAGIPNTVVSNLRLRESDKKMFVFTYGRGAWEVETESISYAKLPYFTGFEAAKLDQYWTKENSRFYGRSRIINTDGPHSGSRHLAFDVSTNGNYSQNAAMLHLNLKDEVGVKLDFWWKEFRDEANTLDGVFFSDDGGSSFVKVFDLAGGVNQIWNNEQLDMDLLAANNGLTLSENFVVKFQQYDNFKIPNDGISVDDIAVTSLGKYAPFPYSTSFDGGFDKTYWYKKSTHHAGRILTTSNNGPHTEKQHLTMDVAFDGTAATNHATLRINLENAGSANLNFWWKELNDDSHPEDGVYISDDAGNSFVKVLSLTGAANNLWNQENLDLAALAALHGLTLNNTFQIRFQQYGENSIPNDGLAFDDVNITPPMPGSNPGFLPITSLIEQQEESTEIRVYPNPTSGEVEVKLSEAGPQDFPVQIQLFDLHGRLLQNSTFNAGSPIQMSLDAYPKGTYLLVLTSHKKRWEKKILKF